MNVMQLLEKNQQVHFQILAVFFRMAQKSLIKNLQKRYPFPRPLCKKNFKIFIKI